MRTFALLVFVAACSRTASPPPAPAPGAVLGAPIAAGVPTVALAAVMKDPVAYKGKSIVTTGTVTAVCQAAGCWMEIADAANHAHIKMAGEKFFVPKTSAGHKARVQATLTDVPTGDAMCAKEAAEQTGGQVATLQLEATGVELD